MLCKLFGINGSFRMIELFFYKRKSKLRYSLLFI